MGANLLTIILAVIGVAVPVVIAIFPQLLEWFYDRIGMPLSVRTPQAHTSANPASWALVRLRIKNRLRTTNRPDFIRHGCKV